MWSKRTQLKSTFSAENFVRRLSWSIFSELRCGGIFSNRFITNFPQNMPVKKFWKSVNIWRRYGQMFAAYVFGPPGIWSH